VTKYKWLSEKCEVAHPPLYFVFYCPECHFADAANDFSKPLDNEFSKLVIRQFQKMSPKWKTRVDFLIGHIDYENLDFRSALALHLLALCIQRISMPDSQDNYKIGRLFLRVAWLYREAAAAAHPAAPGSSEIRPAARKSAIEQTARRIDEFGQVLEDAMDAWQTLDQELAGRADNNAEDVAEQEADSYDVPLREMRQAFTAQFAALERLKALCQQEADAPAVSEPTIVAGSYQDLIEGFQPLWSETPATEQEAMQSAAAYFRKTLWKDVRFNSAQTRYNLISLVTDLYVRCNDLDSAYKMLASLYKSNTDAIRQYEHGLEDKETSAERRKRLPGLIKRSRDALEHTAELRRTVLDLLMERDQPKIDALLAEHAHDPAEKRQAVLVENGIVPELILVLKKPGGPLEELAKRRRRR